ncbi:MAG: PorP/SprF family type IX secretion system membrane protein [Fluviicola sp.]
MNLTRIFTITILALFFANHSFSQQDPRAGIFWNQYMHTNPAMTGAIYKHHANAQWRNQWTKINGAPTILWLNYAMKLDSINSGLGVSYEYDVTGRNRQHTALVSYAYHIPIKKMFLSLGISAGTCSMHFDKEGLVFPENQNDPALPPDQTVFQGDFGIAFHGKGWNAGLSSTQLSGYFIKTNAMYNMTPHYWVFGDYAFQIGENWKLTPRFQFATDLLKSFHTLALIASYKNLWFGTTALNPFFGRGFELGPMIGYDIVGKFRIGYTYEFGINTALNAYKNNVTHEIILSYQLK